MKFKVGDIVRGMKNSPYGITNENMTKGEVIAVGSYEDDDDIIVKVLEHKIAPSAEGSYHPVNSKYFELYDYNKIVITTDGNKTLARLYENNEVVRTAEAKCNPEDTFDFETGAKLAFERLMEKKDEFVPYLKNEGTGKFYGKIGAPTKMKDITGKPLFVGDVVELILKGKGTCGDEYIAECDGKGFVMGIEYCCSADGTIDDCWIVIKKKSYEELENGENYGIITAILEEEK